MDKIYMNGVLNRCFCREIFESTDCFYELCLEIPKVSYKLGVYNSNGVPCTTINNSFLDFIQSNQVSCHNHKNLEDLCKY